MMKVLNQRIKTYILNILFALLVLWSCEAQIEELVGPSASGQSIGITALFGGAGLWDNGSSQATIRVEVFDSNGQGVNGATVTLTTTLGSLGSSSLTTTNGVAVTTLTSGTRPGTAFVVATVDNVSATTAVPIVSF